jgi:exodeoxyribonuclease-3
MKIVSYNLNGIRAAMKKDLIGFIQEYDFDIIGFQELKADPSVIPHEAFEEIGYHCSWFSAQKKGYSGVALLSKTKPDYVETGCGHELFDFEGRVIRADFGDLTILSCYFPSGSSGSARQVIKMEFLEYMQNWVNELKKTRPKLIIMGDYNVAHEPIDVYNPDKAHKMSGHLPEEREWMTKWWESGFTDAFRMCHPEETEYSWWSYRRGNRTYNKGWRIDYQSVTDNLKDEIKNCRQLTDAVHSDHCPVLLELN